MINKMGIHPTANKTLNHSFNPQLTIKQINAPMKNNISPLVDLS